MLLLLLFLFFFSNFIFEPQSFRGRKKSLELTCRFISVLFTFLGRTEHFIIIISLLLRYFFFCDCHPNERERNDIIKKWK